MRDAWLDSYVAATLDAQVHRNGVFDMKPVEYLAWVAVIAAMVVMAPFCWMGWCK
jgi:hypothetical protein